MLAACQRHRLMSSRLFGLQQSAFLGIVQSVHQYAPCRSTEMSRPCVPRFRRIFCRWFHSSGVRSHVYSRGHPPLADAHAGASDLNMSMERVLLTLEGDYPTLFNPEVEVDFGIYDDNITFELGKPLATMYLPRLQGKATYKHALLVVKRLANVFTLDGEVEITNITKSWKDEPNSLRIRWRCTGRCIYRPLHIDGISLYKLGPSSAGQADPSSTDMSHLVVHHKLEFISFEPPFMLDLIRPVWWDHVARYRPEVACTYRSPMHKPVSASPQSDLGIRANEA